MTDELQEDLVGWPRWPQEKLPSGDFSHSCGQAIASQAQRKYTAIISDEEEELIVSADYNLPLIARARLTGI